MMMNVATIQTPPAIFAPTTKKITTTIKINELESSARKRQDRTSNICIRAKHYLVVKHIPNAPPGKPQYKYQWRHVELSREGAMLLLDGA